MFQMMNLMPKWYVKMERYVYYDKNAKLAGKLNKSKYWNFPRFRGIAQYHRITTGFHFKVCKSLFSK